MVNCRENDYEHYVKCGNCGWEGWSAWMRHGYKGYGFGDNIDVEPIDFCPQCDTSEEYAEIFVTCQKDCGKCEDRFLCYTGLNSIPVMGDLWKVRSANDVDLSNH